MLDLPTIIIIYNFNFIKNSLNVSINIRFN